MELTDELLREIYEENSLLSEHFKNLEEFITFYRTEKGRPKRFLAQEAIAAGFSGNTYDLSEQLNTPPEIFQFYREAKSSGTKLSFADFKKLMEER